VTSPYHAQFELRENTRALTFNCWLMGVCCLVSGIFWARSSGASLLQLAIGVASIGLAWGIHDAREWARIAAVVLFGVAAVLVAATLRWGWLAAIYPASLSLGMAHRSMKEKFANARAMIHRTAEIKHEKVRAQKQARERIANRRHDDANA